MNTEIKQKYVPCEFSVVEFKVERGFAEGSFVGTSQGTVSTNNLLWTMSISQPDSKGVEHYRNQQYDDGISWNFQ